MGLQGQYAFSCCCCPFQCFVLMVILAMPGNFPGVIMTIVLRRKIQYHLLQVSKDVRVKLGQYLENI